MTNKWIACLDYLTHISIDLACRPRCTSCHATKLVAMLRPGFSKIRSQITRLSLPMRNRKRTRSCQCWRRTQVGRIDRCEFVEVQVSITSHHGRPVKSALEAQLVSLPTDIYAEYDMRSFLAGLGRTLQESVGKTTVEITHAPGSPKPKRLSGAYLKRDKKIVCGMNQRQTCSPDDRWRSDAPTAQLPGHLTACSRPQCLAGLAVNRCQQLRSRGHSRGDCRGSTQTACSLSCIASLVEGAAYRMNHTKEQ